LGLELGLEAGTAMAIKQLSRACTTTTARLPHRCRQATRPRPRQARSHAALPRSGPKGPRSGPRSPRCYGRILPSSSKLPARPAATSNHRPPGLHRAARSGRPCRTLLVRGGERAAAASTTQALRGGIRRRRREGGLRASPAEERRGCPGRPRRGGGGGGGGWGGVGVYGDFKKIFLKKI
jgi:hypothetical protein